MSAGTNVSIHLNTIAALRKVSLCLGAFFFASPLCAMDQGLVSQHIQLAQDDLGSGKWERSLARFRWLLLESDPDPQHMVAYQNTIASITAEHPLRFGVSGAILPSSNIAKASSHSVFSTEFGDFYIDSSEDRKSGIGLQLGVSATYSVPYARGRSVFVTGASSASHFKQKDLQVAQAGISIGHEWLSAGRQFRVTLSHNAFAYREIEGRDDPDFASDALSFDSHHRINPNFSVRGQIALQDANYAERDYNDGLHKSISITPKIDLNTQNALSIKIGLQDVDIDAKHLSFSGKSIGLFWDRTEQNGIRWGLGIEQHWREFDSRFPALSYNRTDHVTDLVLSASHPRIKIKDMTPRLHCTLRDHGSNVALYDYKSTDCSVSLNYQF